MIALTGSRRPSGPAHPSHRAQTTERRRTLVIASAGTFLTLTTFTLSLSGQVAVGDALHASPAARTWILGAMALGLAAGLLPAGALADDHGRRRVFLAGVSVLAVTEAIGAAAGEPVLFVLARVAQGLGGGAVLACGLGLIGQVFPAGRARARATGVWGATVGAGILFASVLTTYLGAAWLGPSVGWRVPYLLVAALLGILVWCGRRLLTESRAAVAHPVDLFGTGLLGGGLAALLAGLVTGRTGWAGPTTLGLLGGGVLLLAGFVLVERRAPAPLLDLALFRRPDFLAVTAAGTANGAGVVATMAFLPTVAQRGLGGSAADGALLLIVWSGLSVPVALAARHPRVSGEQQLLVGLLLVAAGQVSLAGLTAGDGVARLLPGVAIAGVGSGVLNAALGRQAVASVPAGRSAMGSGVNNTGRFLGSGAGIAVTTGVATRPGVSLLAGWDTAALVGSGCSVLGALVVLGCLARS